MSFLLGGQGGGGAGMGMGGGFAPPPIPMPRPTSPFDIAHQNAGPDLTPQGAIPQFTQAAPAAPPGPEISAPPAAPIGGGGDTSAMSGGGGRDEFAFRPDSILGHMQQQRWRSEASQSFMKFVKNNPQMPPAMYLEEYLKTDTGARQFARGQGDLITSMWQSTLKPMNKGFEAGGQHFPDYAYGTKPVADFTAQEPEVRKAQQQAEILNHSPNGTLKAIVQAQVFSEPMQKHQALQALIDAHQVTVDQANAIESGILEVVRDPIYNTFTTINKLTGQPPNFPPAQANPTLPGSPHQWQSDQPQSGSPFGFTPAQGSLSVVPPGAGSATPMPVAPVAPVAAPVVAPVAGSKTATIDADGAISIPGATDPMDKYKGSGWFQSLIASGGQTLSTLFPDLSAPITTARRAQLDDLALKVTQLETIGQGRLKSLQAPMLDMVSLIKSNGELGAVAGAIAMHNSVVDLMKQDQQIISASAGHPESVQNRQEAETELVALKSLDKALTGGNAATLMAQYNGLRDGTIKQEDVGSLVKSLPATLDKMGSILSEVLHGKPTANGTTTEDIRAAAEAGAEPTKPDEFLKAYKDTPSPTYEDFIKKNYPKEEFDANMKLWADLPPDQKLKFKASP